jgi:hypothetical protein
LSAGSTLGTSRWRRTRPRLQRRSAASSTADIAAFTRRRRWGGFDRLEGRCARDRPVEVRRVGQPCLQGDSRTGAQGGLRGDPGVAGEILLGAGWSAQAVVLVAVVSALLAAAAVCRGTHRQINQKRHATRGEGLGQRPQRPQSVSVFLHAARGTPDVVSGQLDGPPAEGQKMGEHPGGRRPAT